MRKIVFVLFVCIASCTDEFDLFNNQIDLYADIEEVTILYANINSNGHKHFIRINKGFNGQSLYEMSNNIAEVQFMPGEVEVEFQVFKGQNRIKTYQCKDTLIDKESGEDFNTQKVVAFYFVEPELPDQSAQIKYKIVVTTPENTVYAIAHPLSCYRLKKDNI